MRTAAIMLVASASLAACVTPRDDAALSLDRNLEKCGFQDIESGADPAEDLANGMVGQAGGHAVPQAFGSYYKVEDCRTGATIGLTKTFTGYTDTGEVKEPDRTAEVEAVRRLLLGGQVKTMSELDKLARSKRISVRSDKGLGKESCGCATYYPELRGDKTEYVPVR